MENITDFAKKLQSLARKGDSELMASFEGSFEGVAFNEETFDEAFFLSNCRDIIGVESDSCGSNSSNINSSSNSSNNNSGNGNNEKKRQSAVEKDAEDAATRGAQGNSSNL